MGVTARMPGEGAARCGVTAGARGVVWVLAAPGLGTTRTGDGDRCIGVSPVMFEGGEYTGAGGGCVVCIPCAVAAPPPVANPIIKKTPNARPTATRGRRPDVNLLAAMPRYKRLLMRCSQ